MKKLISIFLFFAAFASLAQVPDTSTFEKKARYKIGRIRDNNSRQITPADFRGAFSSVADIAVKRVPFLTLAEFQAGKADTARVIEIIQGGKSFSYTYDPTITATTDTALILQVGTRKYALSSSLQPEFFGAAGDGVTNDTQAINKALKYKRELYLDRDYLVTSFTNTYGVKITGPGRILKTVTGGTQLLTPYADNMPEFGWQHLTAWTTKLINRTPGTDVGIDWFGDSHAWGDGAGAGGKLQDIMSNITTREGIPNIVHANYGQSGGHVGQWLQASLPGIIPNLKDLGIIRYGFSDGAPAFNRSVETVLADMDAALALIRAARPINTYAIIIMTPLSSEDTPNNRDEKRFEQLTGGFKFLAKKWGCAFLDGYGRFQNNRGAAGIYMDDVSGIGIHAKRDFNTYITSYIADMIFPIGLRAQISTGQAVTQDLVVPNPTSTVRTAVATDLPNSYPFGFSIYRATTGFQDGTVVTIRQKEGITMQINYPYLGTSQDTPAQFRYNTDAGNTWGRFHFMGPKSIPQSQFTPLFSTTPINYPEGVSNYRILKTNGWPYDGHLIVIKNADGNATQLLNQSGNGGGKLDKATCVRYSLSTTTWDDLTQMGVAAPRASEYSPAMSAPASDFPFGLSVNTASAGQGWPEDGIVMNYYNRSGASYQQFVSTVSPTLAIRHRSTYYNGSTTAWTPMVYSGTLKAGVTYDPPSIAAGAATTTTVSVPGAQVGQLARAVFSLTTGGTDVEYYAQITGAGNVTVKLTNTSGSAIDIASGTLYVTVDQ